MVKHELRVASYQLLVESLKARVQVQIHVLRVRVTSSNPRFTGFNRQITSSNPRVQK